MNARTSSLLCDLWDGVRTQPGRVGLSLLAIAVGITALTVLLAVLGGLQERARRIVQELGVNVFGIVQAQAGEGFAESDRLCQEHVDRIEAGLPHCSIAGIRTYDVPVPGIRKGVKVVATDYTLFRVRGWRMESGRFLDAEDGRHHARHAAISATLSRLWGWKTGDVIALRNAPYTVVGVVQGGGGMLEEAAAGAGPVLGERVVFVPRRTPAYWLSYGLRDERLDAVFVRVPEADRFDDALRIARRLLAQPGAELPGLSWVTPESLLLRIKRLQNTLKLSLGSIAVLCLVLGGTTLMSLMVSNVRERVAEIGLRRALGATTRDIAVLFVLEACFVTAAGALAGTGVTHALLLLGRPMFPVPIRLGIVSLFVPLLAAVGLGIAFSYWPAKSATRISPSDALRNE
ncbi:MAG: ABC transporter permease [Kiritimatiellae bacterium]|nr:ABC transporter permease [Kiritimatiellia bacterium]